MTDEFDKLFKTLVSFLVSKRIKLATRRHEKSRLLSLFERATFPDEWQKVEVVCEDQMRVSQLLPPRRQWKRLRHADRLSIGSPSVAQRRALIRLVLGIYYRRKERGESIADLPWGKRLLDFVSTVKARLTASDIQLATPVAVVLSKGDKKRYIAKYENLEDAACMAVVSHFLSSRLDAFFSDASYAFRLGKRADFSCAAKALLDYRKSFPDQPLYVAECDIKKFFDVVNHDEVMVAVNQFLRKLRDADCEDQMLEVSSRMVSAYLRHYSVYKFGEQSEEVREHLLPQVTEALREIYGTSIPESKIGLPQGGVLSPILANCLMDAVDRRIEALGYSSAELFYARYCDDMVIASPSREICARAFAVYQDVLRDLKLPIHTPSHEAAYGKAWWQGKSRDVYEWSQNSVPWVGFVGYQTRYDGVIRVRPSTLAKAEEKMTDEVRQAKVVLRKASESGAPFTAEKKREIFGRLAGHLCGRFAGRPDRRMFEGERTRQICWADAFHLLQADVSCSSRNQMRRLDRVRSKSISILAHAVSDLTREDSLAAVLRHWLPNFKDGDRCLAKAVRHFQSKEYGFLGAMTAKGNAFKRHRKAHAFIDPIGELFSPYEG